MSQRGWGMDLIVQALYWISSGLLIPTIVLLLLFLARPAGHRRILRAVRPSHGRRKIGQAGAGGSVAVNARQVLAADHIRNSGLVNIYLEQLLAAAPAGKGGKGAGGFRDGL